MRFSLGKLNIPKETFKKKLLQWGRGFETLAYYDSNNNDFDIYGSFDFLLAAGCVAEINGNGQNDFERLKSFLDNYNNWAFGYLGYDLKNQIETLDSGNFDGLDFPAMYFFVPEILIKSIGDNIEIVSENGNEGQIMEEIISSDELTLQSPKQVEIKSRLNKPEYLQKVEAVRNHIREGDVYELNLCREFFIENIETNPYSLFQSFNQTGKSPFAAFIRIKDKYILSQSPERFLKKQGDTLISQPMKGTIRRGVDEAEDQRLKKALRENIKERAENVMIVDLVRNDLSPSAVLSTVEVKELFGIYTFSSVHQMISTVVARAKPEIHVIDIIKNAFPMGSMTGAPKIMAMQLIENYEHTKRGVYSGAIGYFTPEGDFDFNVVIRTMLFDAKRKYLSYQAGGAITYDSNALDEWEECNLKAKQFLSLFE
jgi:para-aminobenzoate synthetase component I